MKKTIARQSTNLVAPQVHRRLAPPPAAGWRSACNAAVRIGRPRKARPAPAAEVNAWVVDQARRHLRDPHRALGDGAGHAHRPRPARRRGARVRLEEGHDRVDHAGPEPRAQARLGRDGHRRQPRHPHLAGLRPPRRRGRAHDAAAGGGRPVEGAGRRAHAWPTASSRTRPPKRTTTYGKVAAAAAKLTPPDPKSIKLKDPKDWKIAGKPMKRLDTADKLNGSKVYAIDVKLPGMLYAAIKACPVFGGKLVSYDEAKIAGRCPAYAASSRSTTRRSRSSPTPGGGPRRRSTRCRSSGTRAPAPRSRARRSPSTSRRA